MTLVDLSPANGAGALEPVVVPPAALISAEIDIQISTAKRYPRSVERFRRAAVSLATLSEDIARACIYAIPRANKTIEGPSVRLAEILQSTWGNCRVGSRVVEELQNFVVAQGVFHDLETNSALTIEVQRRITDKYGKRYDTDMIGVTGRAACAIARREAILQSIPKPLWEHAYEAAKATVMGDLKTLAQRRNNAMKAFKPFGVTEAQIFAALSVGGMADIGLEQLATLAGFLTAIRDEGKDPEELFPAAETKAKAPPPPAEPQKSGKQAGGAGRAAKAPAATENGPAAAGGSGLASSTDPDELTATEKEIAACLGDAETRGDVKSLRTMFAVDISGCDAAAKARIEQVFSEAEAKFGG